MKKFFSKLMCTFLCSAMVFVSGDYNSVTAETVPDKLIALTFDDGPNTTTTNEVLDILEKYDAKASFFLIGVNINEKSAETVKRAYDMGCEIDNHSKTHSTMTEFSEEEISEEIEYVNDYVFEITGEYPSFFRPPFIAVNQTMYDAIDMPFICGLGCNDFMENVTAQERAEAVISSAKDGLIVLMHDTAGNTQTVEALEIIIPELKSQGYEFVTLNELFERQGETPIDTILYNEVTKYPCDNYSVYKELFSGSASGTSSWEGWNEVSVLDAEELESIGNYVIEVDYEGTYQPVVTLQAWSNGNSFWKSVQPSYYNGKKACFMSSDIENALEGSGMTLTELDGVKIMPYSDTITITEIKILIPDEQGTENNLKELKEYIFGIKTGKDVDCFDAVVMKNEILY